MHIVVTGANGFIGTHLTRALLAENSRLPPTRLTVIDLSLDRMADDERLNKVLGSFANNEVLDAALIEPADIVFHLASVPSGLSESNHALGMDVNIHGTIALLDRLKEQSNVPALVFASSIAVYGRPRVPEVGDDTLPTPNLSYGAEKVIGETLVADYTRRQWIRGCSVRIPGIVARPPEPNGAVSIFFSDLIRSLSSGNKFTCPVSAGAKSWLMSVRCCVENLVLAATMDHAERQVWTLPAMHISIAELVSEIDELFPDLEADELIEYTPDPWVEENFGSYPPLVCPLAEAAGFHHDGSPQQLVLNALEALEVLS
jgi:nucleoside-diphosphate-sugar epimerase